jgi:SHAQKYF class myb-like DNA-binding protein
MPPTASSSSGGRSSKSKKKKSSSHGGGHGGGGGPSGQGENTGRWTAEEHRLFLEGLEQHGKGWKKIASLIKSRTVVQIRTHAQKYFQKLAKARQNGEEGVVTMEGRCGLGLIGGAFGGGTGSDLASISSATAALHNTKRRHRQTTGTKRKAIQSVVASVQRQAKKLAMSAAEAADAMMMAAAAAAVQDDDDEDDDGVDDDDDDAGDDMDTTEEDLQLLGEPVPNPVATLPAVAPTLAHFVLPHALQPPSSNHHTSNKQQSSSFATSTSQGTISGPALEDSMYVYDALVHSFLSSVAHTCQVEKKTEVFAGV